VSGEAGIGKTSLIEQFVQSQKNECRVLWGGCDALFTPRPLGPIYDIARQIRGPLLTLLEDEASRSATGFCTPGVPPLHAQGLVNGSPVKYIFLGNPNRCPTVAGPQFSRTGPTPNNSYVADVLASNLAHALNGLVTNPVGSAWYDRYGLENTDKCQDASGLPGFGPTYLTANGARANVKMGGRDWLIQPNWVNGRKARCAMSR
jgi:hypothetical protein